MFRRRSKKTSKLRVTDLSERNPPVTGGFPSQRASNAENVSIWRCHHGMTGTTLWLLVTSRILAHCATCGLFYQDGLTLIPTWPTNHLPSEFALQMAVNGQKRLFWQQSVCFEHVKKWYCLFFPKFNRWSLGISGADNCKNRSNYDTSNRFGTNTLWGSLCKKKTRATQNFNMAAIFQDGRHRVSWNVIFCLTNGGKWSKKIILTTECMFWACKMYS